MTTYTPTSISTTTIAGGSGFGPDSISNVIQFTLNSHGLNTGDKVYVSSGSVLNAALSDNNSTGITIGSGSSSDYAAWEVHQNDANTFFLKIPNILAVQQSGQTISNSSVVFKKASGQIQDTENGGGNYTNGDSIKFNVDDGGTNYDGYNWVLYQSGLENGFSGSNVNADLDNNPSSSYAATKVSGPPDYYTLSGVTADGTTSNLFSGGQKLLFFVASGGGGGGGGGGGSGTFSIKGTGRFKISGTGKITIK